MASESGSTPVTTADGRHHVTRERALGLAVPALGLVLAVVLLSTSTHLTGPSGWYARVLVTLLGAVALVGTIVEGVRLARPVPAVPARELGTGSDLLDDVEDVLAAADDDEDEPAEGPARGGLLRVGIVVASVAMMILLANVLGLWLAMAIPVVTTLVVLGVRTWWKVALATVLTVAGGYVVFTLLLQVRVPEGILGLL